MNKLYENAPEMWWESPHVVREKQYTCTVTLRGENKKSRERCVVGDSYLPLNGPYELFTYRNTCGIDDGTDFGNAVLKAFDAITYKVGYCYTNGKELHEALQVAGVKSTPYVGWLFVSGYDYPIHHCWNVVEHNGFKSVLDLSDDYTMMMYLANLNGADMGTYESQREAIASFMELVKRENIRNSIRCIPVGVPTPSMLYVGSPCDPDEGRRIYQQLVREFPDHKCERNCVNGRNATQTYLRERGLDEV